LLPLPAQAMQAVLLLTPGEQAMLGALLLKILPAVQMLLKLQAFSLRRCSRYETRRQEVTRLLQNDRRRHELCLATLRPAMQLVQLLRLMLSPCVVTVR